MENIIISQSKIPTERRKKDQNTGGALDNDGFFRTPNGSFWDPDGEYFNKLGFDIHGGSYTNVLDYVPGPDWLSDFGCYPDEKEHYLNQNYNEDEDYCEQGIGNVNVNANVNANVNNDLLKGDFENPEDEDVLDDCNIGISPEDMQKLNIDDKLLKKYFKEIENEHKAKQSQGKNAIENKGKKNVTKKKTKKSKEEEEWESDDEQDDK